MPSTWGAVSNHFRLMIETIQSPASVSAGTGSVTLTVRVYGESQGWGHNWTNRMTFGGAWYGTKNVSFYSATGATVKKLLHETTVSVTPSFAGTVSRTFTANLEGYGASSVSHTHTVARRPYHLPRPPLNPRAVRTGDGQARVTWSVNYDGADGAQPWTGVKVLRRTGTDTQWREIGSLHWSVTSYDDRSAPLNERVEYALRSYNSAGNSATTHAGHVDQRPAAPTNARAVKRGSDIVVTWEHTRSAPYLDAFYVYDGSSRVGSVAGGQRSFTHTNATTTTTHTYTVSAVADSLESARSQPSNTVQLLARPSSPHIKAPVLMEPGNAVLFWTHSPTDSSEQTSAEIRYTPPSGTPVTVRVNGSAQQHKIAVSQPGEYRWQVRTWGAYNPGTAEGASPWSGVTTTRVVSRPTVTIDDIPSVVHASHIRVAWAFYQDQNASQSAVSIQLKRGTQVVFDETRQGGLSSLVLPVSLEDGYTYTVFVRSRSGHGFWTAWDTATFRTQFFKPPQPTMVTQWDDQTGSVVVTIGNPPGEGNVPSATSNDLYRSLDGGHTWELAASGIGINTTYIDYEAAPSGETFYRAVAVSDLPTTAHVDGSVSSSGRYVYLNWGENLSECVRLDANTAISYAAGLAQQEQHYFAGRRLPVTFESPATHSTVSITCQLLPDRVETRFVQLTPTLKRLREFATTPGLKMFRDGLTNTRMYGSSTQMSVETLPSGQGTARIGLTEGEKK